MAKKSKLESLQTQDLCKYNLNPAPLWLLRLKVQSCKFQKH